MTTTIGIYRPGTPATLQATVNIDEKTRMIKKLMGDWHVTADFNVTSVLDIQIGDYITYDGENYYINRLPDITKLNNATFQYKIDFEHSLYNLKKKLFISSDGLADFSYNGTAEDFITNIVAAINEIDTGWTVGTVDSTDPITLQFTNESCHAALVRVAEAFKLEYTITSKAISLIASVGSVRALTFEYGRGKGLYKLTRQQVHDQNIITKVYGFGGEKNISEDYRSRAKRLVFAATGQEPYSASAYPYMTKNTNLYGVIEGQFTDDNIYPQRTSTLTGASISFAAAAPYAFSERSSYVEDSEMDFDINDYLIDGKVATMVFKTGDLAGVECEIWKYDHSNKRFYIRSYADVDGYVMPNYNSGSPIQPEIGDSYTLVNIAMPQTYIDTAEAALQAATQTYINKNSVPQVVYDCLFDWKYAKTQELKLDAGDKVTVTDSDLGIDAQVRIAAIEYPLVNIYKIKATIADFVPYTLQERIIKTTISTKKETVFVERRNTELARRNTMRQNQMQGMLFDSDGYFDPENIKPLSIETTYLSVGTKSRDFWLSNVTIKANYEGDANALYVTAGSLIHLQLEITGVGYEWVISTPLDQDSLTPATAYYLYAKCSTSALTGEWILSASQITTEEVSGYYHFLIGMLFAVSDDRRDFDFTNGMTYINGGTITTGKIQSIGGDSYFDLTQNKFKVGDSNSSLDWNDTAASTLTIKGALVQSGAGTTSVLPCFRGAYASGYTYYKGDEATYAGSTFRWINDTPASGQTPAEGGYWTVIAAAGSSSEPGEQGDPGNYIEFQYAKNGSTTTPPSIVNTDLNPSGWSTTPPLTGSLEYLWMTKATKTYDGSVLVSNWTTPVRIKGEAGAKGDTGPTGATGASPAGVYRGEYDSGSTYYGTEHRVDIVYYSGLYYVARVDAGDGFSDKAPTNTNYWNSFGANFESIATGLLFAEFANIANFIFKNGKLISQKGTINGVESTDYSNANFIPYISLDGNTGDLMAMKATIEGAINAGSIGGFTIANGRIGSLEDEDGLSLLSSLIKFYNVIATTNVPSTSYVWAGIGENVLAPSSGLRALGRFENNEQQGFYQQVFDHYDYYYSVGDYMNAGAPTPAEWVYDENGDLLYIQVTIYRNKWVIISNSKNYGIISSVEGADSNIAFKARKGQISALYGGIVAWDTGYSGAAYSDVLEYYIHRYSNFFFSSISSSLLVVRLPAKSFISAKTYGEVQFFLNIVIGNSANAIQLTSVTNGQIVDNNGNNLSYINMYKGDSVLLRYSNGCYYIVSLRQ